MGDTGGPSVFMRKIMEGLIKRGIGVTLDIDDSCDLILVIVQYDRFFNRKLQEKKKKKIKIIQRLDGVLTFGTSKFLYPVYNFGMKYVLKNLADYVVYQSYYAKFLCDRFLGKSPCKWSIIYNGVDVKKFTPNGETHRSNKTHTLFTLGGFRRKVTLFPIIKAFEYIKKEVPDVKLVIAGPIRHRFYKYIPKGDEHIEYLAKIPNGRVAYYMRGADVFMFSIRSACPNVLLESIACGLPVACYDIGSNREILGYNEAGILVDSGLEGKLYLYFQIMPDPKRLSRAALKILVDPIPYRKMARERAERLFSLDLMIDKYIEVFEKVLDKA